ncbi:hypothetical protein HPP92_018151 [Vanilla planifolia]|uniref:Uncharacterized protein n=1 Tax=Vanilla planifolia TaxID=51239 RepID=A0A835QCF1_VANPL|nr:hypothetical protein HPP92_018151 [Vanilla planifolia]
MNRDRPRPSTSLSELLHRRPISGEKMYPPPPATHFATASVEPITEDSSPYNPSASTSPFISSPWAHSAAPGSSSASPHLLLGSLLRHDGHVFSLAVAQDLLYTGTDGRNIRVWRKDGLRECSGFKSSSGLVKAIAISGDGKVFTGHHDGKIRVWKPHPNDPRVHRRVGTLPRLKDFIRSSIRPSNYVKIRRHRTTVWVRHFDAVSCLSLDAEGGILYSGSWDRTIKVWRTSDSKCIESVNAHDDAVNAVAAGFAGLLFSGSADGTVKMWRRDGKTGRHSGAGTLLRLGSAVTAIAVAAEEGVVYCGSSDGLVRFWLGLEWGGVLRGHAKAVLCVAAVGSAVASGSADRTVTVWRREAVGVHVQMALLTGHVGPVKCLSLEHDAARDAGGFDEGWVVYSGSLDGSVKVWRVVDWRRPAGDRLLK